MSLAVLNIPKNKEDQLIKKGFTTTNELVEKTPRKYHDFRASLTFNEFEEGKTGVVEGVITTIGTNRAGVFADIRLDSGDDIRILWFNQSYVERLLTRGKRYYFAGKISQNPYNNQWQMISPFQFSTRAEEVKKIIPVYSKIKGMADEYYQKCVDTAFHLYPMGDYLEPQVKKRFSLCSQKEAYGYLHYPSTLEHIQKGTERLVFDKLFLFALQLAYLKEKRQMETPYRFTSFDFEPKFLASLPFELTDSQVEVITLLKQKWQTAKPVKALIQGDVGAGKTMIALYALLTASHHQTQSILLAPTNVLAKQHYEEVQRYLAPLGIEVVFLNGEKKVKEKRAIYKQIKDNPSIVVVGTHAVLNQDIPYQSLGLIVVDEEHRFGVKQRNQLLQRAEAGIHQLQMSATPIPRSLALTMFEETMDIFTLNHRPKNRQPVQTILFSNEEKTFEAIARQVQQGHQAYVVCPLIEESDSEVMASVQSVETMYEKLNQYFGVHHPSIRVGMINGRLKPAQVSETIDQFANQSCDVLVSTTIVEVGVNVPNATVMVISNAERFGLAQLHQLRGRVGRGSASSYCVLLSNDRENEKLKVLCETTDGFVIAEKDLQLRGTGSLTGTEQSGTNELVELAFQYPKWFDAIKKEVEVIRQDTFRQGFYPIDLWMTIEE